MKTTFKLLATLFAVAMVMSNATADDPKVPANSWQQLSGGIALSLILKGHFINVHIKNTSNTIKELLSEGPGLTVQPFYIDDSGAKVRLGNHPLENVPSVINDLVQKTPQPIEIPPGGDAATTIAIPITADQVTLLKTHPVVCTVLIYDPATKQKSTLTSPAKILTEALSGK